MNKLLKDAIADAKAVRETALANAKLALEEAFAPKLQSMLSSKIREEMDEEEPMADDEEANRMKELAGLSEEGDEMPSDDENMGGDEDFGGEEGGSDEDFGGDDEDFGGDEDFSDEDNSDEAPVSDDDDLEEILRELDAEMGGEGEDENEGAMYEEEGAEDEEMNIDEIINALREEEGSEEDTDEEEVDLNELLNSLNEEEEEDKDDDKEEKMDEGKKMKGKMKKMEEELNEAYSAVKYLRTKLSEVNLLNAKLLYVNKLFRNNLTETQKVKVIETFDRAKTVREAKLVYATLSESIKAATVSTKSTTKKSVMEGLASKPTTKTKSVINEGNDIANRFKKLAGII